jgi:hypothetical protein
MSDLPITQIHDLGTVPQAGADVHISASPEIREQLARWAGVDKVQSFSADIEIKKTGMNRFGLDARWSADVVQSCVVTLEPVASHLVGALSRDLHLIRRPRRPHAEGAAAAPSDRELDDGREDIDDPHYDLAAPILEDFALSIDPYPRKEGVTFESAPAPEDKPESPFAALKNLKIDR